MTALVAGETLLLVLLTVLVAGLLRSHAEILRRPDRPTTRRATTGSSRQSAPARSEGELAAPEIAGATLRGDSAKISLAAGSPPTLLAFLTSGCTSCQGFWEAFGSGGLDELPDGVRVVAVADGSHESTSRLRELAPDGLPVLLSSAAWGDYSVPGSPYFVYVADGSIHGEGAASQWPQLASLLRDAVDDARLAHAEPAGASGGSAPRRARGTRPESAGIVAGHASLYPSGRPAGDGDSR